MNNIAVLAVCILCEKLCFGADYGAFFEWTDGFAMVGTAMMYNIKNLEIGKWKQL